MKAINYKDLKKLVRECGLNQLMMFLLYNVPIIIDKIFPPNEFDNGYIHGTADDGTYEKYKIYFEEIIIEDPEKKNIKKVTENDLKIVQKYYI